VEPIRRGIEHFLRGRYGYEGYRAFRVLAAPVLIGAILVVGWLLIGPLLTIPRFTTASGPVVRNGVAVIVACGKKSGFERMGAAMKYAPEPRTGTWDPVRRGECTVWYHHPPGMEQRHNRQERARSSEDQIERLPVVEKLPVDER
jgi:hypothetical protein